MLACKATPRPSISTAQNNKTGQNPCSTKNKAKLKENRHVAAKKSLAPAQAERTIGRQIDALFHAGKDSVRRAALGSVSALFLSRFGAPFVQFPLDFLQGNAGWLR